MKPILTLAAFIFATPAFAHPGDHGTLAFTEALAHLFEPDHLIFAAIAVLVGVVAYRAGLRRGRAAP